MQDFQESWALVEQGTCSVAGNLVGPSAILSTELQASGMQANITNEISKYVDLLEIFLTQSQGTYSILCASVLIV